MTFSKGIAIIIYMKSQKISKSVYEATTSINTDLVIVGGINIPVEFVGFGESHFEAIQHCLEKVRLFISPSTPVIQSEYNDDEYMTAKDNKEYNENNF